MAHYLLSPRAQNDMEDIWNYTVKHWGAAQAEHYVRTLKTAIEMVAQHPHLGVSCQDIRTGYYKYRAQSHVVFYRLTDSSDVNVIRILHERMDFTRHV